MEDKLEAINCVSIICKDNRSDEKTREKHAYQRGQIPETVGTGMNQRIGVACDLGDNRCGIRDELRRPYGLTTQAIASKKLFGGGEKLPTLGYRGRRSPGQGGDPSEKSEIRHSAVIWYAGGT